MYLNLVLLFLLAIVVHLKHTYFIVLYCRFHFLIVMSQVQCAGHRPKYFMNIKSFYDKSWSGPLSRLALSGHTIQLEVTPYKANTAARLFPKHSPVSCSRPPPANPMLPTQPRSHTQRLCCTKREAEVIHAIVPLKCTAFLSPHISSWSGTGGSFLIVKIFRLDLLVSDSIFSSARITLLLSPVLGVLMVFCSHLCWFYFTS